MPRQLTQQDIDDAFRCCAVDMPSVLAQNPPQLRASAFEAAKALIKADYKRLCRASHPDLFQAQHERATTRFQHLQEAFKILEHVQLGPTQPMEHPFWRTGINGFNVRVVFTTNWSNMTTGTTTGAW